MNTLSIDLKPLSTNTENRELSMMELTDKPTETLPSKQTPSLIKRMVAGLNRMQVDEAFREEVAKKIF